MLKEPKALWILACGLFLAHCDKALPIHGTIGAGQESDCQTCHLSPPPTGSHSYHIFQQSSRSQITCNECHSTVIHEMNYTYRANRALFDIVRPEDELTVGATQTRLIKYDTRLLEYTACVTNIFGDSIYLSDIKSDSEPVADFDIRDSLVITADIILRFPFEEQKDSIVVNNYILPYGTVIDTFRVNVWDTPVSHSTCNHFLESDTLYLSLSIDKRGKFLNLTRRGDKIEVLESENLLQITRVDSTVDTTLTWDTRNISKTRFNKIPDGDWASLSTPGLEEDELLTGALGEFQILNDTVYSLELDSFVDYSRDVLATLTSDHGNGDINIGFLHERFSLYQPETTLIVGQSGITENKIEYKGAWRPERKSCMSGGIQGGGCHTGLNNRETFWENNPDHIDGQ